MKWNREKLYQHVNQLKGKVPKILHRLKSVMQTISKNVIFFTGKKPQ